MRERLKIDMAPRKLRIESDPYVIFVGRTFVPVIDVYDLKRKQEYFIVISAQSIAVPLSEWLAANGSLKHIELWLNKKSEDKFSAYEIEMA